MRSIAPNCLWTAPISPCQNKCRKNVQVHNRLIILDYSILFKYTLHEKPCHFCSFVRRELSSREPPSTVLIKLAKSLIYYADILNSHNQTKSGKIATVEKKSLESWVQFNANSRIQQVHHRALARSTCRCCFLAPFFSTKILVSCRSTSST